MEKRIAGIKERAVQKVHDCPELSQRKCELYAHLYIAETGDAIYDAAIRYEISLSIKQQLGAERGHMLERMVNDSLTASGLRFNAQQYFIGGECIEHKPPKGFKKIDFVVSQEMPPKAINSIMISCKTTLRERGAEDDAIVPSFRRAFLITYDESAPNASMQYVKLTKGNEKNELGMFCADLTQAL